ncbi:MAG: glycosyltransferase family 4 protein, partial [Planctomycetes bacterium]|nr:glycosyltransferase family 4 protein [Planctomycetota bacterium]
RLPRFLDNYLGALLFKLSLTYFLLLYGRRFDVWHVHQIGVTACLAIILGKLLRCPVVFKLTGTGSIGIESEIRKLPLSSACRCISKYANAYICPSLQTIEEAIAFGLNQSRLFLIPNGVDCDEYRPVTADERATIQKEYGLSGKSVVLFVGRLSPQKNLQSLIQAWSKLSEVHHRDWTLVLVGDGPDRATVQNLIQRHQLHSSVRLIGQQDNALHWYQIADLFILPSLAEGLSNALLEAMSTGVPVIITNVSGVEETVARANCGLITSNEKPDGLSDSLQYFFDATSTLQTMGLRGRELVLKEFSLPQITQKDITLYRDLCQTDR